MINFIKLDSVLARLPKPLFKESQKADFLAWFQEALDFIPDAYLSERKIKIFELNEYKVKLPEDIKVINLVTYLTYDPTEEDLTSLSNCISSCEDNESVSTQEDTNNICKYTINYKLFLDSAYYNNNYIPLKYVGNLKGLTGIVAKFYPEIQHKNGFSVDSCRVLHTEFKDGFIAIDYDSSILNEDCLIVDNAKLIDYLQKYAMYKHWQERASAKEEGAFQMAQTIRNETEIALRRAKGSLMLSGLDFEKIQNITFGQFNQLIKLPEKYVTARQKYN